ncbi:DUF4397 domain-containing protein [Alteribacter keqinensis]|uniref:DUF4397 domain-containing protein n=1 Tax=Alteribacter keqinensis TaxID=2483800 RepID=A0A3M7TUX0_9BACI|nr:DUF4397 domain-containing protein [Alteribacter keqinensis]RNA69243.1 DUF4397 domain-containing protein [Alteribacter keqinensis]
MRKWIMLCLTFLFALSAMGANVSFADTGEGFVRAVHASPDAPAVDIYVNKDKVVEGVSFKGVSEYMPLQEGSYTIRIFAQGANPKKDTPVIEKNVDVKGEQAYTLAAVGPLNQIDLVAVSDDLQPAEGKAKVRAAHFSPDAPAVDIAAGPETILFENVSFPQVAEYLEVDAGTVNLQVRPTGSQDVVFEVPNLGLEAGAVYSALAVGQLEGEPGFDIIIVKDELKE